MSQFSMVGVYQPGDSVLHRLPVGAKVLGLAGFSLLVVLVRDLGWSIGCFAVAAALVALARVRARTLLRTVRWVLIFVAFAAGLQLWWYGPAKAAESALDVLSLVLISLVLTTTTPVNAMLDALIRWLSVLRPVGVNPEKVALAISLTIGMIPGTIAVALATRDGARARGLRHPRAFLSPFVIRVVARAHDTGAALRARGIGDEGAL